jgi:N-acetylneuraminic acid mutarotase
MAQGRREMSAAALDGYIYVPGGMVGDSLKSCTVFERYNVASNTWETLPNLPLTLHHLGVAGLGGKIYIMGGWTRPAYSNSLNAKLWEYDPVTRSFTEKASMPSGVAAPAVSVYDGRIWVVGGTTGTDWNGEGSIGTVQCYNPATNAWTTSFAEIPRPRNHIQSAIVDGKMYVSPGRTNVGFKGDELDVYDFSTNTWSALATLANRPRSGGGLAAVDDALFFIGGEAKTKDGSEMIQVDRYDIATNTWTQADDLPLGVHGMWAVGVGNKIYVPGGDIHSSDYPVANLQVYTIVPEPATTAALLVGLAVMVRRRVRARHGCALGS